MAGGKIAPPSLARGQAGRSRIGRNNGWRPVKTGVDTAGEGSSLPPAKPNADYSAAMSSGTTWNRSPTRP